MPMIRHGDRVMHLLLKTVLNYSKTLKIELSCLSSSKQVDIYAIVKRKHGQDNINKKKMFEFHLK